MAEERRKPGDLRLVFARAFPPAPRQAARPMSVLVVGSIALDDIKTPLEEHQTARRLSFVWMRRGELFSPVNLGRHRRRRLSRRTHRALQADRKIDLAGSANRAGQNLSLVRRIYVGSEHPRDASVELNVFEHFTPALPGAYQDTPFVLLANIAPDLQHHVLDQVRRPRFVIADTMDLWINIAQTTAVELAGARRYAHPQRRRSAPADGRNQS